MEEVEGEEGVPLREGWQTEVLFTGKGGRAAASFLKPGEKGFSPALASETHLESLVHPFLEFGDVLSQSRQSKLKPQ